MNNIETLQKTELSEVIENPKPKEIDPKLMTSMWFAYNKQRAKSRSLLPHNIDSEYYQSEAYATSNNCLTFAQGYTNPLGARQEFIAQQEQNPEISMVEYMRENHPQMRGDPGDFYSDNFANGTQSTESNSPQSLEYYREMMVKDGLIPCEKNAVIPAGYRKILCVMEQWYGCRIDVHFYTVTKVINGKEKWADKYAWVQKPRNIDNPLKDAIKEGLAEIVGYYLVPDKYTRKRNIEQQKLGQQEAINSRKLVEKTPLIKSIKNTLKKIGYFGHKVQTIIHKIFQ